VLLDLVDAMFLLAVLGLIGVGAMRASSVHERNQKKRLLFMRRLCSAIRSAKTIYGKMTDAIGSSSSKVSITVCWFSSSSAAIAPTWL
jgi:hypothetical protein